MYITLLLSYLIGSIPFALVIGKTLHNIDIRNHGSGNLGATNAFRTLGKKSGMLVALGDIFKGTLAASLPLLLNNGLNPVLVGIVAILGHSFPIFAKFKGGKAVATTAGVILFAAPILFTISLLVFFSSLKITKYVSASSILGALTIFVGSMFTDDPSILRFSLIIFVFITYKHRSNIKRIIKKEEPKVKWI